MRLTSSFQAPPLTPCNVEQQPQECFAVEHLTQFCDGLVQQRPHSLHSVLNSLALIAPLLNAIPNVVFFIKDAQARYLLANLTLAKRCGFKTVTPLLGKTSADVFPTQLGSGYTEQDLRVLHQGVQIQDQLIGMAGISHDLQEAKANHPAYQRLAALDVYIRQHYGRPIAMEELRALTGLSVAQIERYCKRIFHLTPRQMIHKVRLERATELLAGDMPITDIALQCGYTDHSAFSRQFKAMTGASPRDFRATLVP